MTRRWRKTDSNHRSLSGRIPLFRLVLPAGRVEEAYSEKPPVLGGTGSSNPASSSRESGRTFQHAAAALRKYGRTPRNGSGAGQAENHIKAWKNQLAATAPPGRTAFAFPP